MFYLFTMKVWEIDLLSFTFKFEITWVEVYWDKLKKRIKQNKYTVDSQEKREEKREERILLKKSQQRRK